MVRHLGLCAWVCVTAISGATNAWADPYSPIDTGGGLGGPPYTITITQVGGVPYFQQGDSNWGSHTYDHSSYTIARKGCALSCLAMALGHCGVNVNPDALNNLMNSGSGYAGSLVNWGVATRLAANSAGKPQLQYHSIRSTSMSTLDSLLNRGFPVIVSVPNHGIANSHFVLVTGKQDSTYTIIDPGYSNRTTLASYGNQFMTNGYIPDPDDVSELDVAISGGCGDVNVRVVDAQGRATGVDASGQVFEQIPDAMHSSEVLGDLLGDSSATEYGQLVQILTPSAGNYELEVAALNNETTSYAGTVTAFASDGSLLWSLPISGIVNPGSVDRLSFAYATPEPASLSFLTLGMVAILSRRRR